MRAFLTTPAPAGSTAGNRITALRWAKRLRELGWSVQLAPAWQGEPCDVLIALHAVKSRESIERHARDRANAPRVVALTGTDLYGDAELPSLALATKIVVLQPRGIDRVPAELQTRVRVIRQSAAIMHAATQPFTACVLAHMRDVKDPLLPARAIELLAAGSRWRLVHVGAADEPWATQARDHEKSTAGRWRWLGARSRCETLRVLAGSALLVLASRSEGGANAVTEAIAAGVPVLSTRIDGSLGILGADYPGYFEVGDHAGLAALLARCEADPESLADLRARIAALQPLVDPAREREAWQQLLGSIGLAG